MKKRHSSGFEDSRRDLSNRGASVTECMFFVLKWVKFVSSDDSNRMPIEVSISSGAVLSYSILLYTLLYIHGLLR